MKCYNRVNNKWCVLCCCNNKNNIFNYIFNFYWIKDFFTLKFLRLKKL